MSLLRTSTSEHTLGRVSGLAAGFADLLHGCADSLAEAHASALVDSLTDAAPAARAVLVLAALIVQMLQHYPIRRPTGTRHSPEHVGATPSTSAVEFVEDHARAPDRQSDWAESTDKAGPPAERERRRRVLAIAASIIRAAAALATLLDALHQTGVV